MADNQPDQYAAPAAPTPEELAALPHDNAGPKLNGIVWFLTAISGLFLGVRVLLKFSRNKGLWWDDIFLVAAWVCITIESALVTSLTHLGYGLHIWDFNLANMAQLLITVNVTGTFSVTAAIWSKTSFAITLLKLTEGWAKYLVWYIIVSMNIAMGLSALFPWVSCTPVQKAWDLSVVGGSCWDPTTVVYYNIFSAAYSATMDFALALLPWTVIWGLQMKRKEKIGVAVAMSMGVFAGIMGIIKTSKIMVMLSSDFADGVDLFIWGNAETTVTIIAASIPTLRVLIRDATNSRRYYQSGSKGTGTNSSRTKKSKAATGPGSNTVVTVSGGPLSSHDPERQKQRHDDGSDRSILGSSEKVGKIVRTNDFSVEYHKSSGDRGSEEYEMGRAV
ncbi:putative integral membrane protein [Lasiosphaeria hispida]|uniref:Integral membrane protein n=1 Tax=Lasiosphaeria hispida TaxID=260671 RepID=A0AAJ0HXH7_9PEZI|nr:putative integral membrane protein [Lasiosphaeria hispida]